ncbi:MAG TPA: hypothetical protein VEC01_00545 [Noviherbaspirillum sp.]|uniref:hypothetical protein n=1 Tax=Noviherbaspirillum sp. TaxID=1926288 RepID=UPI002D3C762C|nr:hypothetical protein [Noviherbaspirillum sp.]HYD93780.1 hypothetical protein [Noviherbaspirillum sp.]
MSLVQKVESGYLQFLRVVFLLAATGAIAIAVLLGVRYLLQHDAQPVPVRDEIVLTPESYKAPAKQDAENAPGDQASQSIDAPAAKDPLFVSFLASVENLGKATDPGFSVNHEPVQRLFNELENDSRLGRAFIKQFIGILDATKTNKAAIDRLKANFGSEFYAILNHYKQEYKRQAADIEAKKNEAAAEAQMKQSQAMWSLYAAGVLFLGFVGLILLIVLLKIERNLRAGVSIKAEPQA